MADNVEADAGSGGATFATDDIGGVHYPRTKIALGAANAVDMDLDSGQQTMANSVPVAIASDQSAVTVAQATAANLNVTEASAAAIKTAVETIDNAISGSEMQVDIVTSALPTGAATSAKQDTIIGHVDGIEGLLTTIDGDTGTLAGAVSGTEMQVDVLTIAAGDNNIGNVDIASIAAGDNNIGNVDIVTLPLTTDTEDGTVADGQSAVQLAITLPYSYDGDNWTRAGASVFRTLDLDESEETVKTSGGAILYGYFVYNASSGVRYIKFYNANATNVSVGSTTPVLTFPVPATTAGHFAIPPPGVAFSAAMSVACTTGLADASTGAPSANDVILNVYYK